MASTDRVPEDAGPSEATAALPTPDLSDIAELSYEAARDELVSIVSQLEAGRVGLEESMTLWQRGEALAAHCATYLDSAQARLSAPESE